MSRSWIDLGFSPDDMHGFLLAFDEQDMILMTVERLSVLLDRMPGLTYLLFGHPNLKRRVTSRDPTTAMLIVYFPNNLFTSTRLKSKDFVALENLDLVSCFSQDDMSRILHVAGVLGMKKEYLNNWYKHAIQRRKDET